MLQCTGDEIVETLRKTCEEAQQWRQQQITIASDYERMTRSFVHVDNLSTTADSSDAPSRPSISKSTPPEPLQNVTN